MYFSSGHTPPLHFVCCFRREGGTLPVKYFVKGFRLLAKPGIRAWVLLPLLINVLIFALITGAAVHFFQLVLSDYLGWLPEWLDFVTWLLWGLFGSLLIIVYGYTFAVLANLVGAPFYGILAERTAAYLSTGAESRPLSATTLRQVVVSTLRREARKMVYFLPRVFAVVLLSVLLYFVPVVNLLVPVMAFLWGAWSMAVEFLDYPADLREVSFDEMLAQARARRPLSYGFGALALLGTSVPVLNLLALPAAVTGATALWFEEIAPAGEVEAPA